MFSFIFYTIEGIFRKLKVYLIIVLLEYYILLEGSVIFLL